MENKISAFLITAIFFIALTVCGDSMAGPDINAQQFQQKAVSQALKNPRNQNYKSRDRYIKFENAPVSEETSQAKEGSGVVSSARDNQSIVKIK